MQLAHKLDHSVINVHYDMDNAKRLFEALGFTVTPRGHHTLGSINHLLVFDDDYLELIGMPMGDEPEIDEISDNPLGIHGMVFRSNNADDTYEYLKSLDFDDLPPKVFSRPVDVANGKKDAKFRTVGAKEGLFSGAGVYFCEHSTPELVWRPEWQKHANGVNKIIEFTVVSTDPEFEANNFATLLAGKVESFAEDTFRISFKGGYISVLSRIAYQKKYGDFASELDDNAGMFSALIFSTTNLSALNEMLKTTPSEIRVKCGDSRTLVRVSPYNTLLEFKHIN